MLRTDCCPVGVASKWQVAKTTISASANLVNRLELKGRSFQQACTSTVLAEIAVMTGFSSRQTFHRAFKEFHGMSPSAFRDQVFNC